MNKTIKMIIAIGLIAAVALQAGCAKKDDAKETASNTGGTGTVNAAVTNEGAADSADDANSADGGANVKVIYGEITEVIGNQISIKEIERPQGFDGTNMPGGGQPVLLGDGEAPPDGTIRTRGTGDGGTSRMQRNDDGTITITNEDGTTTTINPADMQNGGGMPGGGQRREQQYTGETYDIMIPTGIPVKTRSFENGAVAEKEIALDKLTGGDIITITYKADGKAIDSVFVQQAGATGGGMFFGDGGGGFMFEGGDGAGFAIPADGMAPDFGEGQGFMIREAP